MVLAEQLFQSLADDVTSEAIQNRFRAVHAMLEDQLAVDDVRFRYRITPAFSLHHVNGINLVLEKWNRNFGVEWNRESFAAAADLENREAFDQLITVLVGSNIPKVSFELDAPGNCENLVLDGLTRFIKENTTTTELHVDHCYGNNEYFNPCFEEYYVRDPKYLRMIKRVMDSIGQHSNHAVETLRFSGFQFQTTCDEFAHLFSNGPRHIWLCRGRMDLTAGKIAVAMCSNVKALTLECVHFTPETLSLLPCALAGISTLEELYIYFDGRICPKESDGAVEMQRKMITRCLEQVQVKSLFAQFSLEDDYNLEEMFGALRENRHLQELSLDLNLEFNVFYNANYPGMEYLSPTAKDWLAYTKYHLLHTVLQESNTTLEKVNFGQDEFRLRREEMEKVHYLTTLNRFGRGKVRSGDCNDVVELIIQVEVKAKAGNDEHQFGFASIVYGLLREDPSLLAQI